MQVKRCVNLLYSRSDSKESYEVMKFFITEKKVRENHNFSNDSHKDFS